MGWAEAPSTGGRKFLARVDVKASAWARDVEVSWTMPHKAWSLYLMLSLFFILSSYSDGERGLQAQTACICCLPDLGQLL